MTRSDSAGKGNHNKGKGELHDDDDDDLSLLRVVNDSCASNLQKSKRNGNSRGIFYEF